MPELSRRTFVELVGLSSAGLIAGCGAPGMFGSNRFPVPVFSDVHFQPFIPPLPPSAPIATTLAANVELTAQLDAADITQWPAIFEGAANTGNTTISAPGADTNYALFSQTLASLRQNLGTSPAILFTGDFLGHGIDQLYSVYSVNKTASQAAAFVDKTLAFVLQQIRAAVGSVPVYFALGNCDSYTGYGPDSTFLSRNAQQLWTLALNGGGNQQDVIDGITNGGYYSVEPEEMNLMIVALNTIALSPQVTADAGLITAQFSWFDAQLARASKTGRKVWLLMHAPPGADEGTTGAPANDNGQIAKATMMWVDENQASFLGIVAKYPGVIAMSFAGHTHMDEFRLMSKGNALAITAGVSPCFGNNPAYKIFTMDGSSLAPVDYSVLNCNLLTAPSQFRDYYTFSQAYNLEGPLAASLAKLFPTLRIATVAQEQYRAAFYSGNTGSNTITDINWPVYWCGIGYMEQESFLAAVNAF
jgi:sphingomyelin phosphodiesterase acid-like 3